MRFRAKNTWDSAQGYIQCMKCIGNPVVRTDGRTDVRTYGHVTITSLPKFLGLIGYQISLAMELRWLRYNRIQDWYEIIKYIVACKQF